MKRRRESVTDLIEITGAAAKIVEEDGLENLTMTRLADAIGVSRATLYRKVGTKLQVEQLLNAAEVTEPDEAERNETGARILAAARDLFTRQGTSGTSIEDVAEAAGVAPVTIYRHFGGREGLLRAFARIIVPTNADHVLSNPGDDLDDVLARLASEGLRFLSDHRDLVLLGLSADEQSRELIDELSDERRRTTHRLADYFERKMEDGSLPPRDPLTLAAAFGGMLLMLAVIGPERYGLEPPSPEEGGPMLAQLFLSGAGSAPEAAASDRATSPTGDPS